VPTVIRVFRSLRVEGSVFRFLRVEGHFLYSSELRDLSFITDFTNQPNDQSVSERPRTVRQRCHTTLDRHVSGLVLVGPLWSDHLQVVLDIEHSLVDAVPVGC
jgi:hypothetical protein